MVLSISFPTIKQLAALAAAFAAGAAFSHLYTLLKHSTNSIPPRLPSSALLAAVELGGTSCRVAIAYADQPTVIVDEAELFTTDPRSTVIEILRFLRKHAPFAALGIASFGPIDLDPSSPTYGYLTTTQKPGWQNFDLLGAFAEFPVPVGFDTDVNAPAMAEMRYGGHKGIRSCAFITVGTGIGVGLVVGHAPLHGLMHPEGGHTMVLRRDGDTYKGCCRMHPHCVESMVAARACADRAGVEPAHLSDLADDNPVWDDVAYYLAQLCITITYMASPHVIVLSGGIMKRSMLFAKIHEHYAKLNNGYISVDMIKNHIDQFIVPSKFGNQIGIIGAIELARRAAIGWK